MVGRRQTIEIGYMSGASNVTHWLTMHGIDHDRDLIERILKAAKATTRVLSDDEITEIIREFRSDPSSRGPTPPPSGRR
jgi:2-isopropylmalate synthase